MKRTIFLLFLFIGLYTSSQAQTIQEWLIDSKQLPCKSNPNNKCFIIKKKDSNNWEYLDGDISGLIYYEGFVYYVQVVIEEGKDPSSPKTYSLLKIIERSKSTPQFLLHDKEKNVMKDVVPLDFILNGKTFMLSKMENFVFTGDKSDPYIKFVQDRIDGSTGCNRFKCAALAKYDTCSFTSFMMTKMACMDKRGEVETKMRQAIIKARKIEYKNNILILYDASKKTLAEFIEKK